MQKINCLLVFGYIGLLFFFPNNGWGIAADVQFFNLYTRGTGVLPISAMSLLLYLILIYSFLFSKPDINVKQEFSLKAYFWVFNTIFFTYVLFGIIDGRSIRDVLTSYGIVNVFNLYLFMVILIRIINTADRLANLLDFIVLCALFRGGWGIYRWMFLGGDIANIYSTGQKINIKLTFFDINDSLIAVLACFISSWALFYQNSKISVYRKFMHGAMICVGICVVLLSYRRTAWAGFALAAFWFVWQQPWRRRIQIAAIIGFAGSMAFPILIGQRFSTLRRNFAQEGVLYDVLSNSGEIDSYGRFSELINAWSYIEKNIYFGVLPWGGGLTGAPMFVHSGLVHLWLKGGLFVFLVFLLIIISYLKSSIRFRREICFEYRGVLETSFVGFVFILPTLLFGTPFIEFRTSLLIGLIFVLAYLGYGLSLTQDNDK